MFSRLVGGIQAGMGTTTKLLTTLALAGAIGILALPSIAGAARTGVTIHMHRDFLYGYVFSPKPERCAEGRKVRVLKKTGKHKHPSQDRRLASTSAHELTSGPHEGKFRWGNVEIRRSFGNGKVYAFTPRLKKCDRDTSKTLKVSQRPSTKITRVSIQHRENRAIFRYHSVGGIKPYDHFCRLDKREARECSNHYKSYNHLRPGRHIFRVWARGANGLKDPTPAKRTFKM